MITLASTADYSEEIKKSRFVCWASPVDTIEDALRFLDQVRDPNATHNCWAYLIGREYRFTDNGEPGGTAGRPILSAIEGMGLDHVMVVVTRYYGGIKLGTGGLVRAYGGTASKCLRAAEKKDVKPVVLLVLKAPFSRTGSIYPVLERHPVKKLKEEYDQKGVVLTLEAEADCVEVFYVEMRDATCGQAVVTRLEK